MTKLWGGRFTKEAQAWVDAFGASIPFDQKLVIEDIEGSKAHVEMLATTGVITEEEQAEITQGLNELLQEAAEGKLAYKVENEDIHLNLEQLLIEKVGPVGGKLHTGRSRNDQVALDMHLYIKKQTEDMMSNIHRLQQVLVEQAEAHVETIFPGYTHLQRAQPVSFAHHLLAYVWMLERDYQRLNDSLKRVNVSPLGSGALAGTTFPIDRKQTAEALGFADVYANSMDAVSDRDFVLEFLSASSVIMMHLSRLSEEMILWSSEEFNFIELDDTFATGSSIMPQKKNPDMAELVRGKTGRVYGSLMSLLTMLKGLPLAYNKDMQEDKEGAFDTAVTVNGSLQIFAGMIETMHVKTEQMSSSTQQDFSNATEVADYLAAKGMPFREAHEVVGKLVLHCIHEGCYLKDLSMSVYQSASELFSEDIYEVIDPHFAVARRNSEGGTGFQEVREALKLAGNVLAEKDNK
ncbi:argininosuccinate lyase [Salsuginibacillus halophilus]|uniref:Argininosuccinate lyase n=1 Tax=Salsuginibacillus halophilus TaxID=517424 RepID=A0A2P8HEC0_9BACI|nr:argininosuccinate lyase [Salsuginibacillus halophilus]PSL44570.1 argininosuccinate lyase [Salsuginibacillus halophilus]